MSWDNMLYILVLVVGLLNTEDLTAGLSVIETSLSLLALPVLISKISPFRKEHLYKLLLAFTAGLFVTSLICLGNAGLSYIQTGENDVFFFERLTEIIDSHPTYLAYYLIASTTCGLYILHYERGYYSTWAVILVVCFLFLMLMLTGGTTAFVSMLFVLSFFVLKFLLDERTNRQISLLFVVISLITCMFVFNELNRGDSLTRNDSWERLLLWESAMKANPNPFLGVGTGDYRNLLNAYYVSHGLVDFANSNYNPHNQFIDTYLANGLVGLFCLLVLLGRPIYLSVRNGNTLGTLIFFPFIIYGITEVFFGRYQGVVVFAILQQVFIAYYQSNKASFSLKRA